MPGNKPGDYEEYTMRISWLLAALARWTRGAVSRGSDEPIHFSPGPVYCDRDLPARWKLRGDLVIR